MIFELQVEKVSSKWRCIHWEKDIWISICGTLKLHRKIIFISHKFYNKRNEISPVGGNVLFFAKFIMFYSRTSQFEGPLENAIKFHAEFRMKRKPRENLLPMCSDHNRVINATQRVTVGENSALVYSRHLRYPVYPLMSSNVCATLIASIPSAIIHLHVIQQSECARSRIDQQQRVETGSDNATISMERVKA